MYDGKLAIGMKGKGIIFTLSLESDGIRIFKYKPPGGSSAIEHIIFRGDAWRDTQIIRSLSLYDGVANHIGLNIDAIAAIPLRKLVAVCISKPRIISFFSYVSMVTLHNSIALRHVVAI